MICHFDNHTPAVMAGVKFDNMPCNYKKDYPPDWHTRIRPDILERANDCCEICGVKNKDYVFRGNWKGQDVFQKVNGDLFSVDGKLIMRNSEYEIIENKNPNAKAIRIILTIAHLDHDTTNNDYGNLKALCQLHHLRHDIGHHKQSREAKKKQLKLL